MRAPSQDVWWNVPLALTYVARLETRSRGAPSGRVVGGGGGRSGVYGCFGVLSRTALEPLGYGRGWSFLQWCRKMQQQCAIYLRENKRASSYSAKQVLESTTSTESKLAQGENLVFL